LGLTARGAFGRHPPRFQGGDGARVNGALTAVSSGLKELIAKDRKFEDVVKSAGQAGIGSMVADECRSGLP